ncbi:hypothetical protein KVV02_005014 [Mortierella alpina]|uniref:C2H2-type domain-containing protein n=1 Tax=Mortierella alpina TaxID=64518 RepID=A0A9P8CVC9_MORAP|nr:hypothetical protein KVV02_005014 [Mortierella alpina]
MQHRLQNQSYSSSSYHSSSTSEPLFRSRSSRSTNNAAAPPQSMLQAILAEVAASTPPPGPGTDANLYWNQVLQDHLRRRLQLHKQLRQQQQQPHTIQSVPGPLFEDPQFHHCMRLESTIPLLTNLSGTPVWPSASNDMDLDATSIVATAAQTTMPSTAFASADAEDAKRSLESSSGAGPMLSSTLKSPLTMADTGSCMGHRHSTNTPSFGANVLSTSSSNACRHSAQGADAFECDLTALFSSSIHSLGLHGISPSLSHSASSSPSPTSSPSSSPSPSPSITSASAPPTSQPTKPMTLSPLLPCPVPHCFRSFTRAFNLNAHLRTQHNLDPQDLGSQMPYSSSSSSSIPSSPPAATVSAVPSAVISKVSSSSTSGTQQQQHQQSKPFPCHLCTRIFSRKHDLQRHIRVHTGSKPYLCMSCQKAFARTDALSRHYKVEDACRQMVLQLEADESSRRTQRGQVQSTAPLEVKEWQETSMSRQMQPQPLLRNEQQQQQQTLQSQVPLEQHYFYHHHHPQQQP